MKNNKKTRLNGWEALTLCIFLLCATIIIVIIQLQSSPISIIRFEMDNNTKEAVESINTDVETVTMTKKGDTVEAIVSCPFGTLQQEVTCDCAKNTSTPCMAYCWECHNLSDIVANPLFTIHIK